MQRELNNIYNSLGEKEKIAIDGEYKIKLDKLVIIIDQIDNYGDSLYDLSDAKITFRPKNSYNNVSKTYPEYFDQAKNAVSQQIFPKIQSFQFSTGTQPIENIVNEVFSEYYANLVAIKRDLIAINTDLSDIKQLEKTVSDAKTAQKNFQKSFKENLQKQTENSARTLATHFGTKLSFLNKDAKTNETNPIYWLNKREFWLKILVIAIVVLVVIYILLIIFLDKFAEYAIQVAIAKITLLAILYTQYYFATKNYHIYADLSEQYSHLEIIAQTITDFTATLPEDATLKESIIGNASKTLFSELHTGHTKNSDPRESSMIENFINQIPKS